MPAGALPGTVPGAHPAAQPGVAPQVGMVSGAPIAPAGGEVDKVNIILAVVSFLVVVGMVVVLAMMKVE